MCIRDRDDTGDDRRQVGVEDSREGVGVTVSQCFLHTLACTEMCIRDRNKGTINAVEPCFRGAAFTSPQPGEPEFETKVNRIVSVTDKDTELDMYSSKNPNTTTPAMQAVILDVTMPKDGMITAEFNGKKFEHSLGELLEGSRSHFMIGWLSEAILFNRAMPESCFMVEHYMEDTEPERDTDYYYIRVRQRDQQWAWSSPIWVERT